MILEFGKYRLDVDVDRTRAFYKEHAKKLVDDCGCINCCNFDQAILTASDKILSFFDALGVDPHKSPEIFNVIGALDKNGLVLYNGFYHIVGTILAGEDIWIFDGKDLLRHNESAFYVVDENFRVGFTKKLDLLEEDFPTPCIQMEIDAHLPWVMD